MSKPKQWNERFALIEKHQPSDEQITRTFGITQAELDTARHLKAVGTLITSTTFDTTYNPFNDIPEIEPKVREESSYTRTTKPFVPKQPKNPPTILKQDGEQKRRGRKGSKISDAFRAIPSIPISIEVFAKQQRVSVPVLRQARRFDSVKDQGKVIVRTNKDTGVLEIWRQKIAEQ